MVVTMRDPRPYLRELRRLRRAGYGVIVVACGETAADDAVSARRAGFRRARDAARRSVADGDCTWRPSHDRSASNLPARPGESRAGSWAAAGAGAVPLVLAIIAEAAWIAVVANVINEYFLRHPVLEIPAFMAFVAVGFIASRRIAPSVGSRWPAFVLIATIAAALVGVLWAPAARDALALPFPQGLTEMLGANPGGLLAGLAFIRGVAWGHAGLPLPEDKLVRLLSGGLIVVALAAVAGALAIEPWRTPFLASALVDGLIFGGAALLALAFTRQAIAAGDVAAGWQRNPVWVITLLVVIATMVVMSVAVSGQVKPTLELVVAAMVAPLAVVGLIAGWTKRGLRFFVGFLVFAVILGSLGSAIVQVTQNGNGQANGVGVQASPVDTAVTIGVAGSVLVILVLVILVLVRLWMRRLRVEGSDVIEERYVDRAEEARNACSAAPAAGLWPRSRPTLPRPTAH